MNIFDIYSGAYYQKQNNESKSLFTRTEFIELPSQARPYYGSWKRLSNLYPDKGLVKTTPYCTSSNLIIKVKNLYDKSLVEKYSEEITKNIDRMDDTLTIASTPIDQVQIIKIGSRFENTFCKISTDPAYLKCLKKEFSLLDGTHVLDENSFPFIQKIVELAKSRSIVDLDELIDGDFKQKIAKLTKNEKCVDLYFAFKTRLATYDGSYSNSLACSQSVSPMV